MEALLIMAVAGVVLYGAIWVLAEVCTRLDSAESADEDKSPQP